MFFMPACSVAKACRAAAPGAEASNGSFTARVGPDPDVCRPMALLATICALDTGMGGMAGCRARYASMCAPGSAVAQCGEYPGLRQLPTTAALNAAVRGAGRGVPGGAGPVRLAEPRVPPPPHHAC
jgi:hypothetical protein